MMTEMTGKILNMAAAAASFIAAVMLSVSCQKENPDNGQTDTDSPAASGEPAEASGTYTFGESTYDILMSTYGENDYYYSFTFSPLRSGPFTTYFYFSLQKHFADGEVHDVNDYMNPLENSGEYIFIYEDPVHYYSRYRDFQSGTLQVTPKGNGLFKIILDVKLADGTSFMIDYDGAVKPETAN